MQRRVLDLYLGALVVAACWLTVTGPYLDVPVALRVWRPAATVTLFAVIGWLAATDGGHRLARAMIRALAAVAATVIVAALVFSRAAG